MFGAPVVHSAEWTTGWARERRKATKKAGKQGEHPEGKEGLLSIEVNLPGLNCAA